MAPQWEGVEPCRQQLGRSQLCQLLSIGEVMIQINGQYELADFKKAQALHARRGRLATWGVYYVIGLMALITGVGGVLAIMGRFPWSYVLISALVLGAFVIVRFVVVPRQLTRVFTQQKDLSAPFEMTLTDQEFSMRNEFGESHLPWDSFVKWKEDKEMLLLYRSDVMFQMLPKRLLHSDGELGYVLSRLRQTNG